MQRTQDDDKTFLDVIVAGAGLAGQAMALALLQRGLSVRLTGPRPGEADRRTTALMGASLDLLHATGIWEAIAPHACPLKSLTIIDQTGRLFRAPDITFDAGEIGLDAFGYNIPNAALAGALETALSAHGDVWEAEPLTDIQTDASGVMAGTAAGQRRARLVAGADGRDSICRAAAGITPMRWDYGHTAVVCTFAHSRPHHNRCIELHRADGPFTVVPMPGNRSSLVWVERPAAAESLMALGDDAFAGMIGEHIGAALGVISGVTARGAYPLSGLAVRTFARNRIALVGEAAHVVPPIGAQGLNLGFRDVAALAKIVGEAHAGGRDPGSPETLAAYNAARRGDVLSRTLAADFLNRTLIAGLLPFDAARSAGLALAGASGPLRRFMMRRGAGPAIPSA